MQRVNADVKNQALPAGLRSFRPRARALFSLRDTFSLGLALLVVSIHALTRPNSGSHPVLHLALASHRATHSAFFPGAFFSRPLSAPRARFS